MRNKLPLFTLPKIELMVLGTVQYFLLLMGTNLDAHVTLMAHHLFTVSRLLIHERVSVKLYLSWLS